MLETLTFPVIAAAVFTLVGYGISKAERYADALGECLGALFIVVALLAWLGVCIQISTRGPGAFPRPTILQASLHN